MEKIHVMHIAECAGGVDRYLRMLIGGLDRRRFEQTLVASDDYREEDYRGMVDRFVRVRMCNALSARRDGAAVREVRSIVRRMKPDIVYCHSSKAGGIGRLACMGLGMRVVYNPHGWSFSMRGSRVKSWLYLAIEKLLAHFTTQIVVISNYEKLTAVSHGVGRMERIRVIFNGVDVPVLKRAAQRGMRRKELGIADDAYVVGMVGRISPQKAPEVFVRMAEEVKRAIVGAHFLIVGDGDGRGAIEEEIRRRGLSDCFTITGWVDNAEEYIAAMDQAVLLSRWEGFGLALAEYMVERKPIVATETGAIPDIITDQYNGMLVPVDDAHRAAEAVIELYNNEDMRKELVDNAEMKALAMFDVRRTVKEHECLFVNICERGGVSLKICKFIAVSLNREERRAA